MIHLDKVIIYIDDIVVYSSTLEEDVETIKRVLTQLGKYQVKIDCQKSEFLTRETNILGNIVSSNGIKPELTRIKKNCYKLKMSKAKRLTRNRRSI